MTEEYKNNVLRQLTGQLVEGSGNDRPQFITTNPDTNDINNYIVDNGYNADHTFVYEFSYTRNNQQLLFYEEQDDGMPISWFIVITDMNLSPIGIIKEWSSGTAFRRWDTPLGNDTGEGRIYFIDKYQNTYRLIYMNDPTSKKVGDNYEVEILYSYTLSLSNTNIPFNLMKDPDGAKFTISSFNNSTNKVSLNELVINVGSANEWNVYTYATSVPGFSGDCAIYPIWTEELDCRLCFVDASNLTIKVLNTQDNGGTLSLILQKTIFLPAEAQVYTNDIKNLVMKNYNYLYCYSQGLIADDGTSHLYEVDLNAGNMRSLYSTPNYSYFYIQCINGEIFFTRETFDPGTYDVLIYFGMVASGEYYEIYINEFQSFTPATFIINSYNLYSIRIIDGSYGNSDLCKLYMVYNSLNYNGASFNGIQSVISNSVILDGNDGSPVFARNLYNKTITQNTVESTVQIPAYQLNGIDIAEQKLISKNNNNIIFQYNDIQKNVYENVLMNFFNTLTIIDNNENKGKVMTNASSYFVNGLANQDYDNLKALKFRVTYTDNTTYMGSIGNITIDDDTNTATMEFMFYSGVGVSKVEIMSNDETIIYASVDESYDPASLYKVTQEVAIN